MLWNGSWAILELVANILGAFRFALVLDPAPPLSTLFDTSVVDTLVMRSYTKYIIQYAYGNRKMKSISYTSAWSNLAKTMEKVCDDHASIAITRKGEGAVVVISMADYLSLEETAYLLRSPKNSRRLITSIAELEDGKGKEREMFE